MATAHFGDDLADTVKKQLECPVCMHLATTPIYMCPNGHNVCSACQPQLNQCPVCRCGGKPSNRNLFAEQLAQSAIVPCKNSEKGCTETMKVVAMETHLKTSCKFNFKCLFESCPWTGSVVHLADHARNVHHENFIEVTESGVVLKVSDAGDHDSILRSQNQVAELIFAQADQIAMAQHLAVRNTAYPSHGFQQYANTNAFQTRCSNTLQTRYSTAMLLYKNHIFWFHTEVLQKTSFNVQIRLIGAIDEDSLSEFSYQLEFLSGHGALLTYKNTVNPNLSDDCYDKVFVDGLSHFYSDDGNDQRINRNNQRHGSRKDMLYMLKLFIGATSKVVLPVNDQIVKSVQLRTSRPDQGIGDNMTSSMVHTHPQEPQVSASRNAQIMRSRAFAIAMHKKSQSPSSINN